MASYKDIRDKRLPEDWKPEGGSELDAVAEELDKRLVAETDTLKTALNGTKFKLLDDLSLEFDGNVRLLADGKYVDRSGTPVAHPPPFPNPRIGQRNRLVGLKDDIDCLGKLKAEVETEFRRRFERFSESAKRQDEVEAGEALRELEEYARQHPYIDFGPRLETARKAFDPEAWKRSGVLGKAIIAAGEGKAAELATLTNEHPELRDNLDVLATLVNRWLPAQRELEDIRKRQADAEERLEAARAELAAAVGKLNRLSGVETRAAALGKELVATRENVQKVIGEKEEARKRLDASSTEVAALKTRCSNAERDRDSLREEKSRLEAELNDLRSRADSERGQLSGQAAAAEERLEQLDEAFTELAELHSKAEGQRKEGLSRAKSQALAVLQEVLQERAGSDDAVQVFAGIEERQKAIADEIQKAKDKFLKAREQRAASLREAETRLGAIFEEASKEPADIEQQVKELSGERRPPASGAELRKPARKRAISADKEVAARPEKAERTLRETARSEEAPKIHKPLKPRAGERFTNGLEMTMIWVAPGEFDMGSPASEKDRDSGETRHRVRLTKGYWLGRTEVTQGQWEGVMGSNPSYYKNAGKDAPVETVSWDDAMEYCRKLTERERAWGRLVEGYAYTLPTEAQWEYACRAGSSTRFSYGDDPDYAQLGEYAWYSGNSSMQTHSVATKRPNAWGFYDMHGNVWEWCMDWYGAYAKGTVTDPTGVASGSSRVLRGGGWDSDPQYCRSANRDRDEPGRRYSGLGFRAALVAVP